MSDGMTDANRSSEIAELSGYLLGAELNFLTRPTKENLGYIFECCKNLGARNTLGYFGENAPHRAQKISDYYRKFDINGPKVTLTDITNFLKRTREEYRIRTLANLMALFSGDFGPFNKFSYDYFPWAGFLKGVEGVSAEDASNIFKKYEKSCLDSQRFIEDHFTITHQKLFQGEISEEGLERILKESGVSEKLPSDLSIKNS